MNITYIEKSALLYIKEKKVLVTLSKGKEKWYLPGGKKEAHESFEQALVREIKEELDVNMLPNSILFYGNFEAQADARPKGVIVRMHCYTGKFKGILKPSMEIGKYAYFTYAQKDLTSLVDHYIFDDLRNKGLIE